MLWFVGLGLHPPGSIPADAIHILESADIIYLETFTSPGAALPEMSDVRHAPRWLVEDGREILDNAGQYMVALASYGDPMVATTHAELRTRAQSQNIATGTVHASSVVSAALGECGLHHYKAGRTATIMDEQGATLTPYQTTYRNGVSGNHTILLLEYDEGRGFFLDPGAALHMMRTAEEGQRRGVFADERYVVVVSRVGMPEQAIRAGRLDSMALSDFGEPPHCIIVPGPLHFTERDALVSLAECVDEPPPDGQSMQSISSQMIHKYTPMVLEAANIIPHQDKYHTILENARLYVQDAKSALEAGHDEVAVLSIGYADGLVDALRMQLGMGEWSEPAASNIDVSG